LLIFVRDIITLSAVCRC